MEKDKPAAATPLRIPALGLLLATSFMGKRPREVTVPARFFLDHDVQLFCGFPWNSAFFLFKETGETTTRKIAESLFPWHKDISRPLKDRLNTVEGLSLRLKKWLEPIPDMVRDIQIRKMSPPPLFVLDLSANDTAFWITKAETLCGQMADGSHRALAYALLSPEDPKYQVAARILSIHPLGLAISNCLTLALCFFMSPRWCLRLIRRRFTGSVSFHQESL